MSLVPVWKVTILINWSNEGREFAMLNNNALNVFFFCPAKKWIEVSFVQDFLDVQPEIHHLVAMHGENIFLHCLFCDEQVQKKNPVYPENESQRPGKTGKPKKLLEA